MGVTFSGVVRGLPQNPFDVQGGPPSVRRDSLPELWSRRCLFELGDPQPSTLEEAVAVCDAIAQLEAAAEPASERDVKALIRLVTRSAADSEAGKHFRSHALDGLERLARRATGQTDS